MKLTDSPFNNHLYRVLVPKWGIAPLNGEGVALHGGRFNRRGVQAL